MGKLLAGTYHEDSLNQFDSTSAFAIGARKRALILGYDPEEMNKWFFPKDCSDDNNDILINVAADTFVGLDKESQSIINSTDAWLDLVDSTFSYRGTKIGPEGVFYGHEHFGFVDGLSQPEVRGTYVVKQSASTGETILFIRSYS